MDLEKHSCRFVAMGLASWGARVEMRSWMLEGVWLYVGFGASERGRVDLWVVIVVGFVSIGIVEVIGPCK